MNIFEKAQDIAGIGVILTLGPAIFLLITPFIKILIALSILRTAIGISLPGLAINLLSLILTYFSCKEYLDSLYEISILPLLNDELTLTNALYKIQPIVEQFVFQNVREKDIALFQSKSSFIDYKILLPAYFVSQIINGCGIGLALLAPFLVIDLVVSMLLLALSMMMVPPQLLSMPLKLAFVLYADTFSAAITAILNT